MVSKHQSILGNGLNQSTSHQEMMRMLDEIKELLLQNVSIANSISNQCVLGDQSRPPPAPPHQPPEQPSSDNSELSPTNLPQIHTIGLYAPHVFDESSVRNFRPTHTPTIYTSSYTLTVQTTLSTGQPYFAIEPTTMFENVNSLGDLRSVGMDVCEANDKLEVTTESTVKSDVEELDKSEARVAFEAVKEVCDDNYKSEIEVEADCEITNKVDVKSQIRTEMKLISEIDKSLGVAIKEKVNIENVAGEQYVWESQAGGIMTMIFPVNPNRKVLTADDVYQLNSGTLLKIMKFDSSHDWGGIVSISVEGETELIKRVECETELIRKVEGDVELIEDSVAVVRESHVLNLLKFEITASIVKCFLRWFIRATQVATEVPYMQLECMTNHLAELFLLEYNMFHYAPSLIAYGLDKKATIVCEKSILIFDPGGQDLEVTRRWRDVFWFNRGLLATVCCCWCSCNSPWLGIVVVTWFTGKPYDEVFSKYFGYISCCDQFFLLLD